MSQVQNSQTVITASGLFTVNKTILSSVRTLATITSSGQRIARLNAATTWIRERERFYFGKTTRARVAFTRSETFRTRRSPDLVNHAFGVGHIVGRREGASVANGPSHINIVAFHRYGPGGVVCYTFRISCTSMWSDGAVYAPVIIRSTFGAGLETMP